MSSLMRRARLLLWLHSWPAGAPVQPLALQQKYGFNVGDFVSQARGIAFNGGVASVSQHFMCYVEPHNRFDSNCVAMMMMTSGHGSSLDIFLQFLAPLLRAGFQAHGYAIVFSVFHIQ